MIDLEEFRGYLAIDKHALDKELMQQSQLFFTVAEELVQATSKRDTRKEALAVVDARLDRKFRDMTSGKATETAIKSMVLLDKEHLDAMALYLELKLEADKLTALKEAFQQRNYAIRDLCQLFVSQYFAQDSVKVTAASDELIYQTRRQQTARRV
jgi:hypothetical protein